MQQPVPVQRGKILGVLHHVVPVVAVLGEGVGRGVAKELKIAALERAAQQIDLVAGVV